MIRHVVILLTWEVVWSIFSSLPHVSHTHTHLQTTTGYKVLSDRFGISGLLRCLNDEMKSLVSGFHTSSGFFPPSVHRLTVTSLCSVTNVELQQFYCLFSREKARLLCSHPTASCLGATCLIICCLHRGSWLCLVRNIITIMRHQL